MELDLGAVRAFVAVVDEQHFGAAADQLELTQQAVSRRIAKLESALDTSLFQRARGGILLTQDGATFLPHARALVALADRAVASMRHGDRPLRVDVLGTRLVATELIRTFHETHHEVAIDVIVSRGLRSARSAFANESIDVAFARVVGEVEPGIESVPAYLEPLHIVVGREHGLAAQRQVRPAQLVGLTAWMPCNEPGSEWADFYDDLARCFGLTIDTSGPDFGWDNLLDDIASSRDRYTFGGQRLRTPWHPDIVQVPIVEPTPVYPHSMLWMRNNRHPALPLLIDHVTAGFRTFDPETQWLPPAEVRAGSFAALGGSKAVPEA
ncbi:LysR family transcriptional regulator [Saccharopolyspora sp. WRP15-2]|uniref:LysR family transcriptional regulator n=2 Tax=Saccharopolyspora oryzae TaxID=2997343 RepID=A0ABT4V7F0_9PSEU|nr:LysR family transcriptional regulator [Saccharopolyspora oryzae]MDA3629879.1 LysR family transcriptional regulator [Saccharopolyspora oryzae]